MAVIDLDDVKSDIRLSGNAQDAYLNGLIADAQDWLERVTGLVLEEREVTQPFDTFGPMRLRAWPVAADADVAIAYLDASGMTQALAGYRLLAASRPARLEPAIGAIWPRTYTSAGAVSATFMAGYADPADVPAIAKRAMRTLIAGWYADREGGGIAKAAEASAKAMIDRAQLRPRAI